MPTGFEVSLKGFDYTSARFESFQSGDPWERTVEKMADTGDEISAFDISFLIRSPQQSGHGHIYARKCKSLAAV